MARRDDHAARSAGPATWRFDAAGKARACAVWGRELLDIRDDDPQFEIQLADGVGGFRYLDSTTATSVEAQVVGDQSRWTVVSDWRSIGGHAIDVRVSVRGSQDDATSHWSLELTRLEGVVVSQVRFPFLTLALGLGGQPRTDQLLWPRGTGVLLEQPGPSALAADEPRAWELRPENLDFLHYPGFTFAQFLAYFDRHSGVIAWCQDGSGAPKLIQPMLRGDRVRLGFAHVAAWDRPAALGYEVAVRVFRGDWYEAAGIYRQWALGQPWARSLAERSLVPRELIETDIVAMVRIAGELDDGPVPVNEEFVPYERLTPILDALVRDTGGNVLPYLMAWERHGPWSYPDSLPPVGGAASMGSFTQAWRARGMPVGTYCNGTRWVAALSATGYDVRDRMAALGALEQACETASHEPWVELWDQPWRYSMPCCVAAAGTRAAALEFVRSLRDIGLSAIQLFDQNLGGCAFPCFSARHGHPPYPGPWMTEAMDELMRELQEVVGQTGGAISVEGPAAEPFLAHIPLADVRTVPPGHAAGGSRLEDRLWADQVPLYHFLYHDQLLIQGGFGFGPRPFHMVTKNAWNVVLGAIPGGVIERTGVFQQGDSVNWSLWGRAEGDEQAARTQLANAVALRRGAGRQSLVFGRMERPLAGVAVPVASWNHEGERHALPRVFHGAWRSPAGATAFVFANWTSDPVRVGIDDPRAAGHGRVLAAVDGGIVAQERGTDGSVVVPALGFTLASMTEA